MNFCYNASFASEIPEAYLRLLYDVVQNDHTLFVSAQESETAWGVVEPVLDKGPVTFYKPGSVPESICSCDWMKFDEYMEMCS
jgi:glucose-6-phosphate 1-dehydrogenase